MGLLDLESQKVETYKNGISQGTHTEYNFAQFGIVYGLIAVVLLVII